MEPLPPLYKNVVLLVEGKPKKAYICKCYIPAENGTANYCNIKSNTFKGVIRHLQTQHSILLPDPRICHQHEMIMRTDCSVLNHYKQHIEAAVATFNYQDQDEECTACKNNLNAIKMCHPGMTCVL